MAGSSTPGASGRRSSSISMCTPLRSARWPASVATPSLTSIIDVMPARARAGPRSRRGVGRRARSEVRSAAPPSAPVTPTRSPGRAPSRPITGSFSEAHPTTVTARKSTGEAVTSPPATATPLRSASASIASARSASCAADASEIPIATYASPGPTPIAAKSDSAVASALWPTSPYENASRSKWTPSTRASTETTARSSARTTAASSPDPSSRRSPRSPRIRWKVLIRSSSPTVTVSRGVADSSSTEPGRRPFLHRAGTAAAGVGSLGEGRPKLRAVIQYGLIALVFACLALFLVTQWNKLPNYDWRFRPACLVAAFALLLTFFVLQPTLWQIILRGLGERGDPTQLRAAWAKSLIARYVPTSALMVVGRVVLAERAGITGRVCLASVVYELALGVSAAVIGGAYFFIKLPQLEHQPARYAILLVIPIALIGLHPRVFKPVTDWVLAKLGREPLPRALPYGLVLVLLPAYLIGWLLVGAGLFAFGLALQPLPADKLLY